MFFIKRLILLLRDFREFPKITISNAGYGLRKTKNFCSIFIIGDVSIIDHNHSPRWVFRSIVQGLYCCYPATTAIRTPPSKFCRINIRVVLHQLSSGVQMVWSSTQVNRAKAHVLAPFSQSSFIFRKSSNLRRNIQWVRIRLICFTDSIPIEATICLSCLHNPFHKNSNILLIVVECRKNSFNSAVQELDLIIFLLSM